MLNILKTKIYRKKYLEQNKDKVRERHYKYLKENKDRLTENRKEYYKTPEYKNTRKEYRKLNRDKLREKLNSNPFLKLTKYIRVRTTNAIKRNNLSKTTSTMKMLGCDKETLMNHLQSTGEIYDQNFNVYDYDSTHYHIDHKKTFEDVAKGIYTLEEVCHYTNLQILPAEVNLSKGGTSW